MNIGGAISLNLYTVLLALRFLTSNVALSEELGLFPGETMALMRLRSALSLTANWTGPPCASLSSNESWWSGIGCRNGHAVDIVLEGVRLSGTLPPEFPQDLPFLTKLSLRNNSITGRLPENLTELAPGLRFLLLSYNHFSGPIPETYRDLRSLVEVELQYNSLSGTIPHFDQPTITTFNVSHNRFRGRVPGTSILGRFPASSYDGNADLCGSPLIGKPCASSDGSPLAPAPTPRSVVIPSTFLNNSKKKSRTKLQMWSIVLIAAAAALLVSLMSILVLSRHFRRHPRCKDSENVGKQQGFPGAYMAEKRANHRERETRDDGEEGLVELEFCDTEKADFDMDDLLRASAEEIGKGKLGITFRAMPETGAAVVVKRFTEDMNGLSRKEFVQQMQLLGGISSNHENLTRIISFYYSKEEKLVVSEFVPHGNLFQLLHENGGFEFRAGLGWNRRLSIVKGIAEGLNYLHHHSPLASQRVPHANLKSSNVLIHHNPQNNYQPKLTDFGFLPLLSSRKSSAKLAVSRSPEFFSSTCSGGGPSISQGGGPASGKGKITYKSDVYCFGIVLLEIITGRIPGKVSPGGESDGGDGNGEDEAFGDLSDWVRMVVNSDWTTDILAAEMRSAKEGHDEMLKLTRIALECTDSAPEKRPTMSEVARRIEEIGQRNHEKE